MIIFALLSIYLASILLIYMSRGKRGYMEAITVGATIIEAILGFVIVWNVVENGTFTIGYFAVDAFSALMLGITMVLGIVVSTYSIGYFRGEMDKKMIKLDRTWQCYIFLQAFLFSMVLALTTSIPMIMWIAIEGTTLSTAFLINFFHRPLDIEASWKYLIINTLGLLIALMGTLIFSALISSGGSITWGALINNAHSLNHTFVKYGFIFILVGYGTKMGLVPMHAWKPDAYNKGPIPFIALLSTALLNIAFYAILRFRLIVDLNLGSAFSSNLFMFFGIISIVLPAIILYTQNNFKRFFAYSSIENAGILLLAFGFGGIGIFAGLLHILYHSLAKALVFLTAGNIALKYSSSKVKEVRGMVKILPVSSVLLVIGFLALTGIPPFGIFITEFTILTAGFAHHPVLTIIAGGALLLVFIGFLRLVFKMLFGDAPEGIEPGESSRWTTWPLIGLVILLIITSVFLPSFISTLMKASQIVLQI